MSGREFKDLTIQSILKSSESDVPLVVFKIEINLSLLLIKMSLFAKIWVLFLSKTPLRLSIGVDEFSNL